MTDNDIMMKLHSVMDGMTRSAEKKGVKGVAVAGYYTKGRGLISEAKVCGRLLDEKHNYLAIAYAKLSEMCNTLTDSGVQGRPILLGELGYVGGAIKPVDGAFYVSAFSGGSGEDDLAISKAGLAVV